MQETPVSGFKKNLSVSHSNLTLVLPGVWVSTGGIHHPPCLAHKSELRVAAGCDWWQSPVHVAVPSVFVTQCSQRIGDPDTACWVPGLSVLPSNLTAVLGGIWHGCASLRHPLLWQQGSSARAAALVAASTKPRVCPAALVLGSCHSHVPLRPHSRPQKQAHEAPFPRQVALRGSPALPSLQNAFAAVLSRGCMCVRMCVCLVCWLHQAHASTEKHHLPHIMQLVSITRGTCSATQLPIFIKINCNFFFPLTPFL